MTGDFPRTTDDIPAGVLGSGIREVERIPVGHIHRTWRVVDREGCCFALQSLDQRVFPDPLTLADNLDMVTKCLLAAGVPSVEAVGVGPSAAAIHAADGRFWRAARWVDGRRPDPTSPDDVHATAKAFGRFDAALLGLDGLHELIPDFHDPAVRVDHLRESIAADPHDRADSATEAIDRVRELMDIVSPALVAKRGLPSRVAHNDAKIDNVIITDDGVVTVIDLDTVMPGSIVDDIGELVRSVVRPVEDQMVSDEIPLATIGAIITGFTEGFGEISTAEADLAPWAGLVLTVENAIRFLTDFIDGDRYFSVDDPNHNLRRAVTQIDLADRLVGAHDRIVARVAGAIRG